VKGEGREKQGKEGKGGCVEKGKGRGRSNFFQSKNSGYNLPS